MPPRRRPPPGRARTDLPPLKIVRKIVILQLAYYVSATALILFTTLVYGTQFSLDLVLSWDSLRGDTTLGWMLGLVWMLNSLAGIIFLLVLVVRSKLIPDFALTIHFLHFFATSLYTHSIPSNLLWWGLQCASASLMTFGGIWACQWRELRPISLGGIAGSGTGQSAGSSSQPAADEGSPSRGRGRERSLQGDNGEYEMAEMKGVSEQAV
ncbi:integral membrane protein S linking to the trans Golgi network-domain-containing protein [Aspergillus alliaceus]|uniref:Integral membrane protein S linking to the trans Golgi network-domain-containing protein n=1 Tax=Petromyces alliaceus TaxID=209559 RepID=A0A5N6FGQ8_PETAA|nr:integral membrane protein S linking to the trans Golgi network-domain-containing protein [Aspergillus alliaceus]KAB8228325.1 integral membrane protein S linking to the trans Golgi network-domain-containing protein [Aspergillus alliaceus]KAE8388572.1 integral membrane protein S linking to the trans Golgi network-domain-containing protein [Aspergillus alliaceus]